MKKISRLDIVNACDFIETLLIKALVVISLFLFGFTIKTIVDFEIEMKKMDQRIEEYERANMQNIENEPKTVQDMVKAYMLSIPEEEIQMLREDNLYYQTKEEQATSNAINEQVKATDTTEVTEAMQLNQEEVTTKKAVLEESSIEQSEEIVLPQEIPEDINSKIEGITPIFKSFDTSAYCACEICCGKTDAITASGKKATAWSTVAAGKKYPFGTIIYIPALADMPNGGWFTVEDRGGAITNGKLDIFLGSHDEALNYGRTTLEAYVFIP